MKAATAPSIVARSAGNGFSESSTEYNDVSLRYAQSHDSLGVSPEPRIRKRRKSTMADYDRQSSPPHGDGKSSRRSPRKSQKSSSPRSRRSPKLNQTTSHQHAPHPVQTDSRSFLPSLGRISESSPTMGTGYWVPQHTNMAGFDLVRSDSGVERHRSLNQRQSRQIGGSAPPYHQPEFSALSVATASSSGSGSTITQGSYDNMRRRTTEEPDSDDDDPIRSGPYAGRRHPKEIRSPEKVDVFRFIVSDTNHPPDGENDTAVWQSSCSSSDEGGSLPDRPYTPASSIARSSSESPIMTHKPIQVASYAGQDSLHSDSGISVRGSSSDSVGRASIYQKPAIENTVRDEDAEDHVANCAANRPLMAQDWQRRSSSASDAGSFHPLTTYPRPAHPATSLVRYTERRADTKVPQPPHETPPTSVPDSIERSGYDLLASRLSATHNDGSMRLIPIYRRFEHLNHRILLHLQDEIAEMEEHLQQVDEAIALQAKLSQSPSRPASRRADTRYGSELHFQRTDLLGRIFLKISQYSKFAYRESSSILVLTVIRRPSYCRIQHDGEKLDFSIARRRPEVPFIDDRAATCRGRRVALSQP